MEVCLNHLQDQGGKITYPRKIILQVLEKSGHADIKELVNLIKKQGELIDLATIYRTLELFVDLGCVSKIYVGERLVKYEYIMYKPHHHHLICESCSQIEDVDCNEEFLLQEASLEKGFKVKTHTVEVFGLCQGCQKMSKA